MCIRDRYKAGLDGSWIKAGQSFLASLTRIPVYIPYDRASYEHVIIQLPFIPLVIPIGFPIRFGFLACSMEAKKAFMSTSAITRGQFFIVIFSPKPAFIIREHLEKIQGKIN